MLAFIALWMPFVAFAALTAWSLYRHATMHRKQYGHLYVSMQALALSVMLSGIALTIPVVWFLMRRSATSEAPKKKATDTSGRREAP